MLESNAPLKPLQLGKPTEPADLPRFSLDWAFKDENNHLTMDYFLRCEDAASATPDEPGHLTVVCASAFAYTCNLPQGHNCFDGSNNNPHTRCHDRCSRRNNEVAVFVCKHVVVRSRTRHKQVLDANKSLGIAWVCEEQVHLGLMATVGSVVPGSSSSKAGIKVTTCVGLRE